MGHDGEESVATSDGGEVAAEQRSSLPPVVEGDGATVKAAEEDGKSGSRADSVSTSGRALSSSIAESGHRPPLPPRLTNLDLLQESKYSPGSSLHVPKKSSRPRIISTATTALSRTDIHTQSYQDGFRETFAASAQTTPLTKSIGGFGSLKRFRGFGGSDTGDSASIRSYAPTLEAGGDVESLMGEVLGSSQESPAWKLFSRKTEGSDPFESIKYEADEVTADFYREFDEIPGIDTDGGNEGQRIP